MPISTKSQTKIPNFPQGEQNATGLEVETKDFLGITSTSGQTHDISQLHIELHRKDLKNNTREKVDPYNYTQSLPTTLSQAQDCQKDSYWE